MKARRSRNLKERDSFKELDGFNGSSSRLGIERWGRAGGISELMMLGVKPFWVVSGSRLKPMIFTVMVTPLKKVKELGFGLFNGLFS